MSNSNEGRPNAEAWSLQQAAAWIQSIIDAKPRASFEIAKTTIEELHNALKIGGVLASGCVDGGDRRTISGEEWHDYSLKLHYATFAGVGFMGTRGTPIIEVLSVRSFPAAALKYHAYPSGIRIPSADSKDGQLGYHRVITDVLLPRGQIMQHWFQGPDQDLITERALQQNSSDRRGDRKRPGRERARNAINDLYPGGVPDQSSEPNAVLCRKVGQWLKGKGQPDVSNDTILRAAGRRK